MLIHDTLSASVTRSPIAQQFAEKYHSTPAQVTEIARRAKPGLLILYHGSTQGVFDEMRVRYPGHFAIARDLDVF